VTVPVPDAICTPPQKKIYSPVVMSNTTTFVGAESSCKHPPLNTLTVNVHTEVLFAASVAVQVTVVVPTGKVDPLGGLQATVTVPGQLSVPVGVEYVTTAPVGTGQATAVAFTMFAGQVIDGGVVSTTVTTAMHWLDEP